MTGAFIRRGNLDIQKDIRDVCAQRKDHVKMQQECAKERDLRREETSQHLELRLLVFRMERINFYCSGHPVCGILLWQPQQTNTRRGLSIVLEVVHIMFTHTSLTRSQSHGSLSAVKSGEYNPATCQEDDQMGLVNNVCDTFCLFFCIWTTHLWV